jgi:hypothetical protein
MIPMGRYDGGMEGLADPNAIRFTQASIRRTFSGVSVIVRGGL